MNKIIITSIVTGLMVTSLSAEMVKNISISDVLVGKISTELTENDTIDPTTKTVKNESVYENTPYPHVLVNKPSELSLYEIE